MAEVVQRVDLFFVVFAEIMRFYWSNFCGNGCQYSGITGTCTVESVLPKFLSVTRSAITCQINAEASKEDPLYAIWEAK